MIKNGSIGSHCCKCFYNSSGTAEYKVIEQAEACRNFPQNKKENTYKNLQKGHQTLPAFEGVEVSFLVSAGFIHLNHPTIG